MYLLFYCIKYFQGDIPGESEQYRFTPTEWAELNAMEWSQPAGPGVAVHFIYGQSKNMYHI